MLVASIKFGHLPSYHTWASKVSVVTMSVAVYVMLLFDYSLLFRIFSMVQVLVCIEELAITMKLRKFCTNVPTFWHVRHLNNPEAAE